MISQAAMLAAAQLFAYKQGAKARQNYLGQGMISR